MVDKDMKGCGSPLRRGVAGLAIASAMLAMGMVPATGMAAAPAAKAAPAEFAAPEQAVDALVAATRGDKVAELRRILGPGSEKLMSSGDKVADGDGRRWFASAYDEAHRIERDGDSKAVLVVGKDEWPFPIPLMRHGSDWSFDAKAGEEEILNRRVGRDELAAIEVCRAYVEAQRDYAAEDRQGDGLHEYAQHMESRPGQRDGLYWPVGVGRPPSPLGPFMARAQAEGYDAKDAASSRAPYHGYFYRILTRQGPHAPGGAYDYTADGHMIGGFALVAFPARYGDSGVMTFIVNQDGVVHEKNLGPQTEKLARSMTEYDPDESWKTP